MDKLKQNEPITFLQKYGLDLRAGLVVSLIALPLSLGISLASGAPATAGIISAIVGGIIGSYLGGSYVTINGPAAGLIVVVISAIQSLSDGDALLGFKRMLACVVVVGFLQIISGFFKLGRLAAYFPVPVVHGMLTSIGLIIMVKQAHILFGHKAQGSILHSVIELGNSLQNLVTGPTLISIISIIFLLSYPKLKNKLIKMVPAPLIVIVIGVVFAKFFPPVQMVSLPTNLSEFIIMPSFDVILSKTSFLSIFAIYFVASLESILSASAVDKLDDLKRESNFDRELWSKGVVNLLCGLIGGLPIIAEIVRSSANISQGAKSPFANFSHGIFLLVFVALFPVAINQIPLASLAAILVLVGYNLAKPKNFQDMWSLGTHAFVAFLVTIIVTLLEDLLLGIIAGVLIKFILLLFSGIKISEIFNSKYNIQSNGDNVIISFSGPLVFCSALKQKYALSAAQNVKSITLDLNQVSFIDVTSLSIICKETNKLQNKGLNVVLHIPKNYMRLIKKIGIGH